LRGWHPALLDACLQVAGGTFARHTREGEALLPVGIDRAAFFAPLAGDLEVHARCTAQGEVLTTDLTLCDGTGRVVASIEGLHVRRAPAAQIRGDACGALFHAIDWQLAPLAAGSRPAAAGTRLVIAADAKAGADSRATPRRYHDRRGAARARREALAGNRRRHRPAGLDTRRREFGRRCAACRAHDGRGPCTARCLSRGSGS
jgi:hypothetical protein